MEPVKAIFEVAKIDENTWDVIILAEDHVLKSFVKVYPNLFYIEESVFDKKPAVIVPGFPNGNQATVWKEYWIKAFSDPDSACKTCPTVNQLLALIEAGKES